MTVALLHEHVPVDTPIVLQAQLLERQLEWLAAR